MVFFATSVYQIYYLTFFFGEPTCFLFSVYAKIYLKRTISTTAMKRKMSISSSKEKVTTIKGKEKKNARKTEHCENLVSASLSLSLSLCLEKKLAIVNEVTYNKRLKHSPLELMQWLKEGQRANFFFTIKYKFGDWSPVSVTQSCLTLYTP